LGGTLGFFIAVFIIIEMLFIVRPNFSVTTMKCIIISQAVAFCVVLPTLLFTNHPWGGGVGVLGYLFLIPPSLVAAFSVRFLYPSGDRPVLEKTVTLAIFALCVIGLVSWFVTSYQKYVSHMPSKRTKSSHQEYSEGERSQARAALDTYWSQGVIQKCNVSNGQGALCVDGVRWKGQSKEMQVTTFRQIIRSYSILGYRTDMDIIDKETGEVYATSRPGTAGVELEFR
jgi:hypothetical protein